MAFWEFFRWSEKIQKKWDEKLAEAFPELLQRFYKGDKKINGYGAVFSLGESRLSHGRRGGFYEIYWDSPVGIILTKNDMAVAGIGFKIKCGLIKRKLVHINQIQGVRGRQEFLPPKWERFLVSLVVECAKKMDFKRVEILPSQENEWYTEERAATLKIRYDVTAQRLGFKPDKESSGVYFKSL